MICHPKWLKLKLWHIEISEFKHSHGICIQAKHIDCRIFHSTPLVNYTENESLSVRQWTVSTCMSGDLTLSKMCGFDEKVAVLWRFDQCHTFHSTPLVNCTENGPLSVSQWAVSTCLSRDLILSNMCGFDEEVTVLWRFDQFCDVLFIEISINRDPGR